jgi:hypothetical protein
MLAASMPMHSTQQKEQFSLAYLRAIVAVAGYNITSVEVDEDSIDIGLRGNRRDAARTGSPSEVSSRRRTRTPVAFRSRGHSSSPSALSARS